MLISASTLPQPSQFFDEVARRAMGLTENLSNNLSAVYNVRETELNQSTSQETEPKQTEPIHRNKLSPSIKKPSKKVGCIVHLLDNKILTFDIDVSCAFGSGHQSCAFL